MANVKRIVTFVVALAIPLFLGYLPNFWLSGGPTSSWYVGLNKAPWNPPNWAFPVAWTLLYATMGFASWLVYDTGDGFRGEARLPLILYIVQLLINIGWQPIFFGAHLIVIGTFHLILLVIVNVYVTVAFYPVNKVAAFLQIPYLAWLTFASSLIIYIWASN